MTLVKSKKINRSFGGSLAINTLLVLFGMFLLIPIVYTVSTAFKPMEEIFEFPPRFFVRNPRVDNFVELFQLMSNSWVPFSRYVFNSFFISIVGTVGHVLIASIAAFPLAKYKFPGNALMRKAIIIALLFTPEVTFIPRYVTMSFLGIINTYLAILLPAFQTALGLFLMINFMTQVPDALIEAAKIDGAKEPKIFWKVVMPQVKPAWLTLIIFQFRDLWNDFGTSFIYDEALKPLPAVLNQVVGDSGSIGRAGVGAAVALLLLIPPALLFIISQNFVLETMSTSGIK